MLASDNANSYPMDNIVHQLSESNGVHGFYGVGEI